MLRTHRFVFGFALAFALALVAIPDSALAEDQARPEQAGGIYDKPYITDVGGAASVGGYMDMEFEWNGDATTFDQHRFVPFITGYVSDRVTVSAEIEFEHGGNVGADGEIKLEYAVADFRVSEAFNFRSGVILSPLGSFNLLHDSPLNDLTARPVVSRQIIPSTLSESGMGIFGTTYPGEESVLSYEAYLVNGFDEGVLDVPVDTDGNPVPEAAKLRIRGGRGSQKTDNNKNKAFVGRLGFSPVLGTNFGASVHTGKYDAAGEQGLTIAAVDAKFTAGALELQGEAALASAGIDRDLYPNTAEKQGGAFAQVNYHVLHDRLLQGSVVTVVGRLDRVDFDRDTDGDHEDGFTFGVNFRPTEETVFKFDYNWTWKTPAMGERSDAANRFFFSMATYF